METNENLAKATDTHIDAAGRKSGAPTPQSATASTAPAYTSYDQVPWFRKRWFLLVSALVFIPATVVIAFTGPLYMNKGGQVQEFPKHQKWVILGVCIALIAWNLNLFE